MPRRHVLARRKLTKHHTRAEKLHLRNIKKKRGPCGQRRAARRHEVLETLDCGCVRERVRLVPCLEHAEPLVTPAEESLEAAEHDPRTVEEIVEPPLPH